MELPPPIIFKRHSKFLFIQFSIIKIGRSTFLTCIALIFSLISIVEFFLSIMQHCQRGKEMLLDLKVIHHCVIV